MQFRVSDDSTESMTRNEVVLSGSATAPSVDTVTPLLDALRCTHEDLLATKNLISSYFLLHKWDYFKKIANAYEMIYSPTFNASSFQGASAYRPVSRSFFKLWEIMHDFEHVLCLNRNAPVRAAFLAEGPGGFLEAFVKYRHHHGVGYGDSYHGITLIDKSSRSVPIWRVGASRRIARLSGSHGVFLHSGEDGTGNLYRLENIDHFVAEAGGRDSMTLVTADGGFDFSRNFNFQEEFALQIVTSQVCAAMHLQAPGGAFVLKVYDIHTPAVVLILSSLSRVYIEMFVVKPLTSRPANSEKYVVCTGRLADNACQHALRDALRYACSEMCKNPPHMHETIIERALSEGTLSEGTLSSSHVDSRKFTKFLRTLVPANAELVAAQKLAINAVIQLITDASSSDEEKNKLKLDRMIQSSIAVATGWCERYGMPLGPQLAIAKVPRTKT
jgi:23S rRNA U2552 (ribose-2'-O)-methylase RlmE/FtsJ